MKAEYRVPQIELGELENTEIITQENWREYGHCKDVPLEVFFPERWDQFAIQAAKRICAECVVIGVCLDTALDQSRNDSGVIGGTSERERRRIRKQRTLDEIVPLQQ